MTALRNPDEVWPAETMAEIIARLGHQHEQHLAGIKALDAKLQAYGARLERASLVQNGES